MERALVMNHGVLQDTRVVSKDKRDHRLKIKKHAHRWVKTIATGDRRDYRLWQPMVVAVKGCSSWVATVRGVGYACIYEGVNCR